MLIISHLFSVVISGRLSREKWRSSTPVCRSCCTAPGSERHQPEVLKKFYRSLIETVRNTSPEATIMVSGPLPTYRQGRESDACGETTLPVSCWIGGPRLKHPKPMFTIQHRHNTMDHTAEDTSQDQSKNLSVAPPGLRDLDPEPLLPSLRVGTRRRRGHRYANGLSCLCYLSERHQAEVLKKDYRSLIETVRNTLPEATIVSGPLPTCRHDYDSSGETTRRLWAEDVIISGFIHSGTTTPWITQRKTRAKTRARTSPPPLPVFEISTRNRFSPLCESERDDAVVIGTPMFLEILNGDERIGAVVLNVGANDIRLSDACGESTLPVSCWIGGQRLKYHMPMLTKRDDAVIIGTSMIRHIRATSGEYQVRTHCFPGAHVLDVAAQVPEIMNSDKRVGAVVLNFDACGETTLPVSCWIGEDAIISGFIQASTDTTPWITQRKTRARTRARTSPPPGTASPLFESERDATVIMGTSMVRHVRAISGKDKVRTHCFSGAHVLDVAAQVPEILNVDERVRAVVLNGGANDIRMRF
ncbi:hypothetical protein F2P79_024520 [Pimephales promelas]|nr:hypothetical protein F2P79_024520 [Pimephales promelas]